MRKPLVSVWMVTYNHEKYIAQAIESVLMQKTNFPFILNIGEDCSTDRTREICVGYKKKYSEKINLILNNTNNIKENVLNTYNACFKSDAKYIALCEGDDYWTDPLKLQKQVDFLEKNKDYVLTSARFKILNESTGIESEPEFIKKIFIENNEGYTVTKNNLFSPYILKTLNVVFKSEALSVNIVKEKYFKDIFLWADLLTKGKGFSLNFYGGIYRVHNNNIWAGTNKYYAAKINYQTAKNIYKYFNKKENGLYKSFYISAKKHFVNKITHSNNRIPVNEACLAIKHLFPKFFINKKNIIRLFLRTIFKLR